MKVGFTMAIPIIDLHCDALLRMYEHDYDFYSSPHLDVNVEKLQAGHVQAQAFAIFVMPDWSKEQKLAAALKQVDYFNKQVIRENVVHIKKWADFNQLRPGQIGAFLTIEGVGFFGGDIEIYHQFQKFGVLVIGLTWNGANEAADGLCSDLGRGVTAFGKEIIRLNNAYKIFTDVSHLNVQSFWNVLEHADYVLATHSNAKRVCDHPRNLNDAQIKAMIAKNAPIHVVYYPEFTTGTNNATMQDLLRHVDYICAMGGKHLIGIGSDFDGIDYKIVDLEHAGMHQNFINELLKHYSEADVRGFAYANFLTHLPK
ncbi:dipeptidase [Lysinibacillus sp. 2017]|uniref:dipeptidase n=2 Tax=unclassified Lysinibacillus TaxID=2636778 RepID=UPI001F4117A8|nr:dipeptidase [Lysinibacillus sp. 2017]